MREPREQEPEIQDGSVGKIERTGIERIGGRFQD